MTNELPPGWVETTVGDVCLPVSQRGPSGRKETFRYIDLGAIDNKKRRIADPATIPTVEAPSRAKQIVRAGDVVFSTVRVYLENIGLVPAELDGDVASTAFCVLRPASGFDPRYLYYYVTSRPFITSVNKLQRGNSPPSVQDGDVRRQKLPIAPSDEQGRIASKIDELFSRIDEGERALERVAVLVERYRQSVLKAAVTGELTRAWREKNKHTLESGEALLARILTARREAWEKAELEKMKAKGITPANDKWKQKYQEPSPPDTTDLPELPNGWAWASFDQLTSKITSGSRDWKDYYGRGESVFVMAQNVRPRRLDFAEVQLVDPPPGDRDAERSEVRQHDLLVTIVGANTGDVCRVPTQLMRHYVCQSVALARPVLPTLSVFLELYLAADEGGQAKFAEVIYGAGRPHLSFDQLREIAIPLPPIAEQQAACAAVDLIESEIQAVTAGIATAGRSSSALRQATLRSAFSGTLVPQDPADKPASSLLERIATERAADTAAPKRGRKKKPTA